MSGLLTFRFWKEFTLIYALNNQKENGMCPFLSQIFFFFNQLNHQQLWVNFEFLKML